MPHEHQGCQIHPSSSHHGRTYPLSSQECPKSIKIVSGSFQLQPPLENLQTVKPRMPQEHQHYQIHSSSSHHERTYILSSQECPKSIKTVRFLPAPATMRTYFLSSQECHKSIKPVRLITAPATMRELTIFQAKNGTRASKLSNSFQLQVS